MSVKVRIWDLPTRLFHWALVVLVAGMVLSGYKGGDAMQWHARMGYAVLALLIFRVVWGFVGGYWSRFRSFTCSPASIRAYVRGEPHPEHLIGHNPLGAVSVFIMLAVLLAQVATGLVGDDELSFTGPLNRFVANSAGLAATGYHKRIGQWLLFAVVGLHVGAVLYYQLRRKTNLIGAMISGDKVLTRSVTGSADGISSRARAAIILGGCFAAVMLLVRLNS